MSVSAVASAAGTTRAAIYRRWPDKADLATAAIAALPEAAPRPTTGNAHADLDAELRAFQAGLARPDGIPMIGTMLQGIGDNGLIDLFRERVVAPRRSRLRDILDRARRGGELADEADIEVAVSMCTGSWYALALAGRRPPADWHRRVTDAVWRSCGGEPPPT